MEFVKRTEAPSYTDKYWIHTSDGGLNSCILISGDSVLPNCVGYAWGRAYELLKSKPKLSRGNAEDWYAYSDGYERSQSPRVGSIICWRKGDVRDGADGAGHVAVVEAVYDDGSILTSNSSYGGRRFWTKTYAYPYVVGSSYDFQGFIYLPLDLEDEDVTVRTEKTVNELAQEVIAGLWGNNPERKEKLISAGYDYDLIQAEVNNILSGNSNEETTVIYTVKSGDSLSKIAKEYETTWQKIYEDNKNIIGSNPNLIKVGQKLTIK